MQPTKEQLDEIIQEIELLNLRQQDLQYRIESLTASLQQFKASEQGKEAPAMSIPEVSQETTIPAEQASLPKPTSKEPTRRPPLTTIPAHTPRFDIWKKIAASDLEKFIGENLISKIGIAVLVIGVGLGTKYAIDRDLISPLARIILGYLLGAGLLTLGLRTREKYADFSAILVSGAMAVFYLITFAAFNFYRLIPQGLAFGLMVLFTSFTVFASYHYSRQWIALIALVGGYSVPFLLSQGTGNVTILFGYMFLLNSGILAVSVRKYWQVLYITAFVLTWTIMISWLINEYFFANHFAIAMVFSGLFFLLFYAVFLLNKLLEKKTFGPLDVIFLLLNSFIFFGIGFYLIDENPETGRFAGLFTLLNALIHFVVALNVYRMQLADRNLFFLVSGLVLVFITLAVPVQFDGGWVTLTWAAEAALLFWIGRIQRVSFYEWLSYPLMFLAVISQFEDWSDIMLPAFAQQRENSIQPFVNTPFLLAAIVCIAFGWITYFSVKQPLEHKAGFISFKERFRFFSGSIFPPAALLLLMYFTFRQEIIHFWENSFAFASNESSFSFDYKQFSNLRQVLYIWILNYSLLFFSGIGIISIRWFKANSIKVSFLVLSVFAIIAFLLNGLPQLGALRDSSLHPIENIPGISLSAALLLRYITIACSGVLLVATFQVLKSDFQNRTWHAIGFDLLLHLVLINIISHELITWLKINAYPQFDKLGLSICWGIYSLMLIGLGIFKNKKHLRVAAIVLFAITLIKLFAYDLVQLNTISKTVVFIALGILMLTISFLYNKYKNVIPGSDEE